MCELHFYRRALNKDKKLAKFDYTIVKAYSDKILQTSVTVSNCRNLNSIYHNERFIHFCKFLD